MSIDGVHVLVTDAHANAALAAVRSLGAAGMRVTVVVEQGRMNLAGASRFADGTVLAPPAAARPHDYAAVVLRELRRRRYALLLPITDTTVTIINGRRDEFDHESVVALPGPVALRFALDKASTVALARQAGVSAPATWSFESIEEALERAGEVPYPCVIKPRFSRQWNGCGPVHEGRVRFVPSAVIFRDVYPSLHRPESPPLVQERVPGRGVGVFALVDHGRVLTMFFHRRLRESSPTGGPASLAESLPAEPRLGEPARALLERAGWHGVAMVEFKDSGCGSPSLMEINGRLWGSLPLAIAAGVDFPYLLAQLFLNERPALPSQYRVGLRCRHLRGDLNHLVGVVRGAPEGWPDAFPGVMSTLAAIAPLPARWIPYNMRINDPRPALVEAWRFITGECNAIVSRAARRAEVHR